VKTIVETYNKVFLPTQRPRINKGGCSLWADVGLDAWPLLMARKSCGN